MQRTSRTTPGVSPTAPFAPSTAEEPSGQHSVLPPVLGTKLPFTGIALWLALLVAAGLLAGGTTLRRLAPR